MRIVALNGEFQFDVKGHIFASDYHDIYLTTTNKVVIVCYGQMFGGFDRREFIVVVLEKPTARKTLFRTISAEKQLREIVERYYGRGCGDRMCLPVNAKNAIFEAFDMAPPFFKEI